MAQGTHTQRLSPSHPHYLSLSSHTAVGPQQSPHPKMEHHLQLQQPKTEAHPQSHQEIHAESTAAGGSMPAPNAT
jgi:hypothetical protein